MKSFLVTEQIFKFSYNCGFCHFDSGILKTIKVTASDREFFISGNSKPRIASIENNPAYIVGKNHGYKATCIVNMAKRGIYPVKISSKCPNCGKNQNWDMNSITVDDAPKLTFDALFPHKTWYRINGSERIRVTWDECNQPKKMYSFF